MATRSLWLAMSMLGLLAAALDAAPAELRGTWLTTTSSNHLTSANVRPTMATLRQTGLNTVYVEAWKNGYTNFPSATLQQFTGSNSLNPSLAGRDLLAQTTAAARDERLVHVAWFEYGLAAQFGDPLDPLGTVAANNGWLLKDRQGNYSNASNGFAWMNPLVPQVRNLIKGIAVEAVQKYDLQGVQFDDRLSWPVEFGYDDYTRAAYLSETGRSLPINPRDAFFSRWRREKMQAFAAELYGALKAAKPGLLVSLSPSISSFSTSEYNADWSSWLAAGLFDEVIPQAYRSNIGDFNAIWPAQLSAAGAARHKLSGGLRILGTGAATPWNDLRQMLDRTRADDATGHSLWFSQGVFGPAGYQQDLARYYDVATLGPAPHPVFGIIPEPTGLVALAALVPLLRRRRASR